MAEKKAFVLRINPEILKELDVWAQEEFRSLNGQIEFILHEALRRRKRTRNSASGPEESRPADEQKKNAQP